MGESLFFYVTLQNRDEGSPFFFCAPIDGIISCLLYQQHNFFPTYFHSITPLYNI